MGKPDFVNQNHSERNRFPVRKPAAGSAFERMSDAPAPREVSGTLNIDPHNGPHGHRPVYFFGRQIDDAKVWTSALFPTFT